MLSRTWTARVGSDATAFRVSSDGRLLAVGTGSGAVFVFDVEWGTVLFQLAAHPEGVLSLDWSPTSQVLATAGQDGFARLFDLRGDQLEALPGLGPWVEHVSWSPNGEMLATSSEKVVCIWTAAGALAWKTDAHEGTVTGVAWNHHSTELVTACYGGAQLFRVARRSTTRRFPWRGSLISLAWSPTGAVIACGTHECSVRFWRISTGQDSEISGFPSQPRVLSWDSEGRLLATGGASTVNVWGFEDGGPEGTPPIQLSGHSALCTALAFHPSRAVLASGADDMRVLLWEPRNVRTPLAADCLEDTVTAIAWTPDGARLLAADASGTVRCWRLS